MKPCIHCEIVPFDRQGNQVERGDPKALSWGWAIAPKHRGACLAACGCARKAPASPVVETLPVPSTRAGVKRKTRSGGRR